MFYIIFYIHHFCNILLWFYVYISNIFYPSYLFLVSRFSFSFFNSFILLYRFLFFDLYFLFLFYFLFVFINMFGFLLSDIFIFFIFLDFFRLFIDIISHTHLYSSIYKFHLTTFNTINFLESTKLSINILIITKI